MDHISASLPYNVIFNPIRLFCFPIENLIINQDIGISLMKLTTISAPSIWQVTPNNFQNDSISCLNLYIQYNIFVLPLDIISFNLITN